MNYLKIVERVWLTPTEYANKYEMSMKTVYLHIHKNKILWDTFKGQYLVKDEKEAEKL